MNLSTVINHLNNGMSIKFSKKDRPIFQLQKKEDYELISFNYFGQRIISPLKKTIYKTGSFVKIDKKGLTLLNFSKKEINEIMSGDLYNKKYDIKIFKRPIRKSEGAKPINQKLEEYFKEKEHPFQAEFRTYARGVKAIADYTSIQGKEIITYEVKSDVDSFVRLEKQVKDYKKYSNKIYIVLHHKKENLFMKNHSELLNDCGLIIFDEDGNLFLKEDAKNIKNKRSFDLLIYKEKKDIFSEMRGRSKIIDKRKCFKKVFDKEMQSNIILSILSDRFSKRARECYDSGFCDINLSKYQNELTEFLKKN